MTVSAYALTIDGCPRAFCTMGATDLTLPTTSTDWPAGITTAQMLYGFLVPPEVSWTERMKFLEGDLEVGSLGFRIHDGKATWLTSTVNIGTYLFTRNNQTRGQLAATISSTATSIQVRPPSTIFTGTNFVIWIEQEAILCSSISGDTITVSQRGYYGTRATSHTIDAANNYYPTVWVDYPGAAKRRVLLWAYDTSNGWSILYEGYCNKAPRLASNGALIELQVDHALTTFKQQIANINVASTHLAGVAWDSFGLGSRFEGMGAWGNPITHPHFQTYETDTRTPYSARMLDAAEASRQRLIANIVSSASITFGNTHLEVTRPASDKLRFVMALNGPTASTAIIQIGGVNYEQNNSGRWNGMLCATTEAPYSDIVEHINPTTGSSYLHVNSFEGMPTTFALSGSTDTCLTQEALYCELEEAQRKIIFLPTASYSTSPVVKFKGQSMVKPLKADSPTVDASNYHTYITFPAEFSLRKYLSADHWLGAVRYGLIGNYSDNRNWNWTNYNRTKSYASVAGFNSVEWVLNNGDKLWDRMSNYCKFFACCPAITTNGKLTIVSVRKPNQWEVPAATISVTDEVQNATWGLAEDGIVNRVTVKSDYFKEFVVNQQASRADYDNTGYNMDVDITGMSREADIAADKSDLVLYLNNKFFDLFSAAYATATITLNLSWFNSIFLGDFIRVTDWLIPDGTGNRSISSATCYVVGRTPNLGKGTITYELLIYPTQVNTGYSPCARISAIDIVNKKLTINTGYISTGVTGSITDYAGSNMNDYSGSYFNDGGTGTFAPSDRCKLILRNSTTFSTFALTLATVTPSSREITVNETITTASVDWPAQATAGNVDLIYNTFDTAGTATTQKGFAWVGNDQTNYIGSGVTQRAQRLG